MNKVILIGRLTRDPELTTISSGTNVCKFSLAVDRTFKDANGNQQTDFLPIIAWRAVADNCAKFLSKGSLCCVSGAIQVRSYDDKNGEKRFVTEIIADAVKFLDKQGDNHSNGGDRPRKESIADLQPVEDDNLPF